MAQEFRVNQLVLAHFRAIRRRLLVQTFLYSSSTLVRQSSQTVEKVLIYIKARGLVSAETYSGLLAHRQLFAAEQRERVA